MDSALAECLGSSSLKQIEYETMIQAYSPNEISCPAVCTTMRSNYTLCQLLLKPSYLGDAAQLALIKTICRLNLAGRSYMEADANSKLDGYKVLGEVKDDLNCLFYHLRENPVLCERETEGAATTTKVGKKRSLEEDDGGCDDQQKSPRLTV
jgi:hypothetical protein